MSGMYILPYTTPLGGGNRKNNFKKREKKKLKINTLLTQIAIFLLKYTNHKVNYAF